MKKSNILLSSLLLGSSLLSSNTVFAEKDEHREHDSHQHGHAQLSVILEKNDLLLMLESPSLNILGFEHQPKNDQEKQVIATALKDLKNFETLLGTDEDAKCRLVKTNIEHPFAEKKEAKKEHDHEEEHDHNKEHAHEDEHDEKHEHKDEHAHDNNKKVKEHDHDHDESKDEEHAHEDEHGHDKEHAHDDEHAHEDDDGHDNNTAHSDIDAELFFECKNPSKLKELDLSGLFKRFPLFEELDVQGIINGKQSAKELNKKQTVFSIKN